ncbi:hypothetical protein A4G20_08680 [Pasteurellaceae bacterium RH1A]|nr:hypothetical protein A4G20_08680 [Pasteurellaceae bacterium RH1A]
MLKKLNLSLVLLLSTLLTACGWHFANNQLLPQELQTLTLESSDEYSDMSRTMRSQLLLNNVKLVPRQADVAVLRLTSTTSDSKVASVFKQGREAEKILSVKVEAIVTIPNKGQYPIDATIHRTFFDDSRAALAKSAEREMIMQDMYEHAARQLIVKMVALNKATTK